MKVPRSVDTPILACPARLYHITIASREGIAAMMLAPETRGLLLDIEGTTSSIRFVFDVMFPYVRTNLPAFLVERADDPAVRDSVLQMARDAGAASVEAWLTGDAAPPIDGRPELLSAAVQPPDRANQRHAAIVRRVNELMDADSKTTGLKQLQGLVWEKGFHSGQMKAHVYPDVPAALQRWTDAGLDIRIYSSGSIAAQKLFFGHTEAGDLLHYFRGHYDTTIGGKRESSSYAAIATEIVRPPHELAFFSDIVQELDAAKEAGLQTVLVVRPGNAAVDASCGHPRIASFDDVGSAVRTN